MRITLIFPLASAACLATFETRSSSSTTGSLSVWWPCCHRISRVTVACANSMLHRVAHLTRSESRVPEQAYTRVKTLGTTNPTNPTPVREPRPRSRRFQQRPCPTPRTGPLMCGNITNARGSARASQEHLACHWEHFILSSRQL